MVETIFHGGVLWTPPGEPPGAEALAVRDGRIRAVGRRDDVLALRGPGTRMVDLGGQVLLPGFIDAHAHIWKIGHLLTSLLDVRGASSLADLLASLREQDHRLPAGAWLQARGYNEARFPEGRQPTRADHDAIVPDRPVVLMRMCAHIIACNSAALARAGVGRETTPPGGGVIDRDDRGEPTGILRETAMGLVLRHVPAPTSDEYAAMIVAALRHQLSHGITSTTDAGVVPELRETYRRLDTEGRLPSRVNVMALRVIDGGGLVPLPHRPYVSDRLRIDTVKFFADGGLSGATAALRQRYRHADTRGVLRFDDDELLARTREAHDAGWRVATHAIGDAAIEQVLGVYDALDGPASRPAGAPRRHRIEHFGLPTPAQLAWAARLGVIAAPQTIFVHELGRNFRQYLPDALVDRAYPVRSMLDAGVTVALSSDAPVVEDDAPLLGMQAAIRRRDAEGHAIAPREAITIDEAVAGYTRGAACASGDDTNRGALREGYWADFAVLSGNPRDTPVDALTSLRVTQTWVGGELAYDRGE